MPYHKIKLKEIIFLLLSFLFCSQSKSENKVNDEYNNAPNLHIEKVAKSKKIINKIDVLLFDEVNYILPFYCSKHNPPSAAYGANRRVTRKKEFKYKLSFMLPVQTSLFYLNSQPVDLYIGYNQLSFWQLYHKSAFFRETNYEPKIFLSNRVTKDINNRNWIFRIGVSHKSNGRGGDFERSINSFFGEFKYNVEHWLFSARVWFPILREDSIKKYNPDIEKYSGYESIMVGYKLKNDMEFTIKFKNLERGFKFLSKEISFSAPFIKHVNLFFQVFEGYEQSLIQYNQKNLSFGVGISMNNWL